MKKNNYIGKRFLVIALIFAGVVNAQGRWELIGSAGGSLWYIDTNSISMLSPGRYLIWQKSYPFGTDRQRFMEVLKGALDADKFEYIISRVEIDCSTMKQRLHSSTYYSYDGEAIRQYGWDSSKWEDFPPESIGEKFLKRVCTKLYDAKEM